MSVRVRHEGDVAVLEGSGPLTLGDGNEALRARFREAIDRGDRKIVVNYAGVSFIDSSVIAETVACLKRARDVDAQLKLVVAANGKVARVLELTALDRVFAIYPDEPSALASFG
jgi:anti-sigma B factor antagonist